MIMKIKERFDKVKKAVFGKPYRYYFIVVFLLFFAFNIWVNQTYLTGPEVLFHSYRVSFLIPFLLFNFLIVLLVPLVVNLSIMKFKDLKEVSTATGGSVGILGIFSGLLGGACPGCFVGLFPAFLGLFGITASLSVLPFYGLEIQVLSIVLLMISVWLLTRETTCKVDYSNKLNNNLKTKKRKK